MARKGVAKVLGRAATGALNLSVLGGAVIGAVALASWPIAALGGAAYAALIAADVSSPEFRRRVMLGRLRPAQLPAPDTLRDPEVRSTAERIAAARRELDQVIKSTPARIQRNITTTLAAVDELESHAAQLAVRADELARYLATVDPAAARRDAQALTARAAHTADTDARASYSAAAETAHERATALDDIVTARERALAHLARVETAIKAVPSKLVRLRALDDQASDALTGDLGAELGRMNSDLTAFEQTLEAIVEVSP
jgi:hypothetical protein